jgi:hypothetical protein
MRRDPSSKKKATSCFASRIRCLTELVSSPAHPSSELERVVIEISEGGELPRADWDRRRLGGDGGLMRSTRVSRSACERWEELANARNNSCSIGTAAGVERELLESPSCETMRPGLAGWYERKGTT